MNHLNHCSLYQKDNNNNNDDGVKGNPSKNIDDYRGTLILSTDYQVKPTTMMVEDEKYEHRLESMYCMIAVICGFIYITGLTIGSLHCMIIKGFSQRCYSIMSPFHILYGSVFLILCFCSFLIFNKVYSSE